MRLRALECGDESVGNGRMGVDERRRGGRRRGCRKAVECDVEAELEGAALEGEGGGMVRVGTGACAAEEGGGGRGGGGVEESCGDMKRSDLGVAAAASEVERVFENGGGLGRQSLLDCASSCSHCFHMKNKDTFYMLFLLLIERRGE